MGDGGGAGGKGLAQSGFNAESYDLRGWWGDNGLWTHPNGGPFRDTTRFYELETFERQIKFPDGTEEAHNEFWQQHEAMAEKYIERFQHAYDVIIKRGLFTEKYTKYREELLVCIALLKKRKTDPRYAITWVNFHGIDFPTYVLPYGPDRKANMERLGKKLDETLFKRGFADHVAKYARLEAQPSHLLGLPTEIIIDLISLMSCEEVLKLRVLSVYVMQVIDENIESIHRLMRQEDPLLPPIKFLPSNPSESAAARASRAKYNFLLFRNMCGFSRKILDFAAPPKSSFSHDTHRWKHEFSVPFSGAEFQTVSYGPPNPFKFMHERLGPTLGISFDDKRAFLRERNQSKRYQRKWWRYLLYLRAGLNHSDAQYLAQAPHNLKDDRSFVPVAVAQTLLEWDDADVPAVRMVRSLYRRILQCGPAAYAVYLASMKASKEKAAADGVEFVIDRARADAVKKVTQVPIAEQRRTFVGWPVTPTATEEVYNPALSEHQLLALIKIQFMDNDQLKEALAKIGYFARTGLTTFKDRYNALVDFVRNSSLPPNFGLDASGPADFEGRNRNRGIAFGKDRAARDGLAPLT